MSNMLLMIGTSELLLIAALVLLLFGGKKLPRDWDKAYAALSTE